MGAASPRPQSTEPVLDELKERGLMFVDDADAARRASPATLARDGLPLGR